jgi:hypothetical protein
MKKLGFINIVFLLVCLAPSTASAAEISLFDWALNIDGNVEWAPPIPAGFDGGTGIGTWTITLGPNAGDHNVIAFFDHEIVEEANSFFNEYGSANGTLATGQSWEIDEPGYIFGDIDDNFIAGALDNTNGVPADLKDDVSMAMGWDFMLGANEIAKIQFHLVESIPAADFYLEHVDPDSLASIYFWSELEIQEGGVIPEPSTIILVFSGLGIAAAARFRKIV